MCIRDRCNIERAHCLELMGLCGPIGWRPAVPDPLREVACGRPGSGVSWEQACCCLTPAGPVWCPSESAAPCSIGETSPDGGSGVVEVVDWAMSGVGPGLKLVNL